MAIGKLKSLTTDRMWFIEQVETDPDYYGVTEPFYNITATRLTLIDPRPLFSIKCYTRFGFKYWILPKPFSLLNEKLTYSRDIAIM